MTSFLEGVDPAPPSIALIGDHTIRHRLCNDLSHLIRRLDEVPVGKVSVTGCGPVPPVPEQAADQGQVLAGHDGMAGIGVAKIVESQPTETRIFAHGAPARRELELSPALSISREQEGIGAPASFARTISQATLETRRGRRVRSA